MDTDFANLRELHLYAEFELRSQPWPKGLSKNPCQHKHEIKTTQIT